jgi:aminopeptidase-like protein
MLHANPNGRYLNTTPRQTTLAWSAPSSLAESLLQLLKVIRVFEENDRYLNLNPKCEPQLSRRGLYRQMGGTRDAAAREMAMLWVLSDGQHDLLDIAVRSGDPVRPDQPGRRRTARGRIA